MDNRNDEKDEKRGLFIPTRQVSAYTAVTVVLAATIFMSGYFLGKKQVVDQFVSKIEQESFADQIYSSMCAMYEQEMSSAPVEMAAVEEPSIDEVVVENNDIIVSAESESNPAQEVPVELSAHQSNEQYYAQLIGYGTKRAAEKFVQKLTKKGIPALVKTRSSRTAQGKSINWYQVVTKPFEDRESLDKLTRQIAREERIQGIQVLPC